MLNSKTRAKAHSTGRNPMVAASSFTYESLRMVRKTDTVTVYQIGIRYRDTGKLYRGYAAQEATGHCHGSLTLWDGTELEAMGSEFDMNGVIDQLVAELTRHYR